MLLIKTKIGPSNINGIGLFAAQFIPKGTLVWKFKSGFDQKIKKSEIEPLSQSGKEQFLKYAYLSSKNDEYVLCFDDARFFNHSDDPNCVDMVSAGDGEPNDISCRDISEGEELTCDYRSFSNDFDYKMSI